MSVCDVRGFGAAKKQYEEMNQDEALKEYEPHVKVEIVCEDRQEASIVESIKNTAHTGLRGDGNIFVSDIQKSIRISKEVV